MTVDYRGLLAELQDRRDKLTALIDALLVCMGDTAAVADATTDKQPARPCPKRAAVKRPAGEQAEATSERDEVILTALRKNGGMATSKMLRAAMPKEPSLSAIQQMRAYTNTMSRLKRDGKVGRTGDTWSVL